MVHKFLGELEVVLLQSFKVLSIIFFVAILIFKVFPEAFVLIFI
jgi:hypothetical protein